MAYDSLEHTTHLILDHHMYSISPKKPHLKQELRILLLKQILLIILVYVESMSDEFVEIYTVFNAE